MTYVFNVTSRVILQKLLKWIQLGWYYVNFLSSEDLHHVLHLSQHPFWTCISFPHSVKRAFSQFDCFSLVLLSNAYSEQLFNVYILEKLLESGNSLRSFEQHCICSDSISSWVIWDFGFLVISPLIVYLKCCIPPLKKISPWRSPEHGEAGMQTGRNKNYIPIQCSDCWDVFHFSYKCLPWECHRYTYTT